MVKDHPLFIQGIAEFQSGEYYRCHDSLEALWMNLIEPEKTFIQGILQIAVGCYHLTNSNAKGSMILLGEGIKRLKNYRPEFETVDVSTLVQTSAEFLATLQSLDQTSILAAAEWIQTHPAMDEPWRAPTGEVLSLPTLRQAPPNL